MTNYPSRRIGYIVSDSITRFRAFNLNWRDMQFCRWYFEDLREYTIQDIRQKVDILEEKVLKHRRKITLLTCKNIYYLDLPTYPRP